jgi:hypothetical protein
LEAASPVSDSITRQRPQINVRSTLIDERGAEQTDAE